MPKISSPYSISTMSGSLQLSKGAFLTMMRRKKNSTIKTVCKSKPISIANNMKKTLKKDTKTKSNNVNNVWVKKQMRLSVQENEKKQGNIFYSLKNQTDSRQSIQMIKGIGEEAQKFEVWTDTKIFNIQGVPTIDMFEDNDGDSTWGQVWDHTQAMALTLSMNAYDRTYGN